MTTREEWVGRVGQEWARRSVALDALLGPAGRAGLEALAPERGWTVLDLGCGAGASTEALAEAVGPEGRVVGVDVSPDLMALAQERLAGRANVELIEADAARHPFAAGSFDALYSRFGAMFFDDPRAAFANLHRALKPGAPAVFVAWRDISRNQWASVPMTFAAEALPGARPAGAPGPGPFAWAEPATYRPVLEGAGFRDVSETAFEFMAEIGEGDDADPLDRAVAFMMRIGPLASRLKDAPPQAREEARAFLARRLARHVQDGAVRLLASAWIVRARA